jgi:cell division protein FtsB
MRKEKKQADVINIDEAREKRRQKRETELNKKKRRVTKTSVIKEKLILSKSELKRNNRIRYLVFFGSLIILFFLGVSMFSIVNLKVEENKAIALQEKLKNEKISLQNEIININSPEYIEQQARIQLKMIKPGEVLYVFPLSDQNGSTQTTIPNSTEDTNQTEAQ